MRTRVETIDSNQPSNTARMYNPDPQGFKWAQPPSQPPWREDRYKLIDVPPRGTLILTPRRCSKEEATRAFMLRAECGMRIKTLFQTLDAALATSGMPTSVFCIVLHYWLGDDEGMRFGDWTLPYLLAQRHHRPAAVMTPEEEDVCRALIRFVCSSRPEPVAPVIQEDTTRAAQVSAPRATVAPDDDKQADGSWPWRWSLVPFQKQLESKVDDLRVMGAETAQTLVRWMRAEKLEFACICRVPADSEHNELRIYPNKHSKPIPWTFRWAGVQLGLCFDGWSAFEAFAATCALAGVQAHKDQLFAPYVARSKAVVLSDATRGQSAL